MTLKKAISHVHTHHSFDCRVSPRKIVEKAVKMGIDYLLITDHDSLAGSIEAAAYAKERGYSIRIPVAAEYSTNVGDIIVAYVPPDFERVKDHAALCLNAKACGGVTILPHPFKGHQLEKIDFSLIDCVEIYNSRCSASENLQAQALAANLEKPVVYGSDAHTLADLDNAVFAYEGPTPFNEQTVPLRLLSTSKLNKEYSRMILGVKLRKPKEVLRAIKRSLIYLANNGLKARDEL